EPDEIWLGRASAQRSAADEDEGDEGEDEGTTAPRTHATRDSSAAARRPSSGRRGGDRATCEEIDAVVQRVAAVALGLVPGDLVPAGFGDEERPEITVRDRLLRGAEPAVALPALPPSIAEAVHDVGGIGVEVDAPDVDDRGERFDRGAQLHALVGGVSF